MKKMNVLAATLLVAFLAVPPAAQAADPVMAIVNKAADKCIDRSLDIPQDPNAVRAQLWSCGGNRPYTTPTNQIITFEWVGRFGGGPWETYRLHSGTSLSGSCLSVDNNSLLNAAKLSFSPCVPGDRSQMWMRAAENKDLVTTAKWINLNSGKCIDASSPYNGVRLQQYDCARDSWGPQDFQAYYTTSPF